MTSKELRIGNLVYGVSDRIEEVRCIWPTIVSTAPSLLLAAEFSNELDDISPIPLTEEWLLKFGFEDVLNGEYVYSPLENLYIWYSKDFNTWQISPNSEYPMNAITEIKYVHTLQNLIFTLTGEELLCKE